VTDTATLSHQARMGRRTGLRANNTSGYKGVSWYEPSRNWRAQIMVDGRSFHVGYYDTALEAAHEYDKAARAWFGADARTNRDLGLLR